MCAINKIICIVISLSLFTLCKSINANYLIKEGGKRDCSFILIASSLKIGLGRRIPQTNFDRYTKCLTFQPTSVEIVENAYFNSLLLFLHNFLLNAYPNLQLPTSWQIWHKTRFEQKVCRNSYNLELFLFY